MSSTTSGVHRSVASGRTVDHARDFYQGEYNGRDFQVEPIDAEVAYRYTVAGDDDLDLRGNLVHARIHGLIEIRDQYVVNWFTAGEGAIDLAERAVPIEHGRPIVFANDRPIEFEVADYRQNLIHFRAEYLERIAAERSSTAPGPLRFRHDPPLTEAAIRRWHETVGAVSTVLGSDRAPHLLREQAKRSVAEALLDLMPHAIDGPRALPATASGRRLRRAVDFIHANAHRPLTITDIAEAAGLSLRGVQSAFRTNLEVAPLVYLRGVRLDRAREELLDAGGSTAMVSEIAQRWGFAHLGRFAGYYAERFGEHPSTTLRRSRRASA